MHELPAPVQSSSYCDDEPFKVIFFELQEKAQFVLYIKEFLDDLKKPFLVLG